MCDLCAAMGYGRCDICGGVVFHPIEGAPRQVCDYHLGTGELTAEEEALWYGEDSEGRPR